LPRVDSKVQEGHRGFEVKADPRMSIKEAARRRDFTMNTLAADPLTGELFDYFGGVKDIKNRTLRITDEERFKDDPLRILRGVQFSGRLGLTIEPKSMEVMQQLAPQLQELSKERIGEEWKKLLLKSDKPSLGLSIASSMGVLWQLHPEMAVMEQVPQELRWHPEGDAWVHTMMTVDEAACIANREKLNDKDKKILLFGALCHDLGKASTTKYIDGTFRSLGHEKAGGEPTKKFLTLMGLDGLTRDKIVKIVENHLVPTTLYIEENIKGNKIKDGSIRRLAKRIHPATIRDLVLVAEADHMGRGKFGEIMREELMLSPEVFAPGEWLLKRARELEVEDSKPADLTRGQDWIVFGFKTGPIIGKLIKLSNDLRDEKNFTRDAVFALLTEVTQPQEAIEKLETTLHSI
jgi:tRNA nucleotidyltransferase (CCA-adding enzyme)